jgi:hypothetical protein
LEENKDLFIYYLFIYCTYLRRGREGWSCRWQPQDMGRSLADSPLPKQKEMRVVALTLPQKLYLDKSGSSFAIFSALEDELVNLGCLNFARKKDVFVDKRSHLTVIVSVLRILDVCVYPGSRIWILHLGSRIKGSKRHRILDPNCQQNI